MTPLLKRLNRAASSERNVKFWDQMQRFHEFVHKNHPTGVDGLVAVRFLRAVFEPSWKEELSYRHPFRHQIGHASADNYEWLIQYSRKIRTARLLPGFAAVERRFGNSDEFLAASAEMEVALMLNLGGFKVQFLTPTGRPTPDLQAERDGDSFGVEIGSLNRPAEDARLNEAMSRILTRGFVARAATGGVISRPPTDEELDIIDRRVESAIAAALDGHEVKVVNLPGLATIYVAPRDLGSALPEDSRGQFRTIPLYDRSPEERIARSVRKKLPQFVDFPGGVVLFLYDYALGADAIRRLFESPGDDIGVVLASIPYLVGLALVESYRFRIRPKAASSDTWNSRILLTVSTGVDDWADILLWVNRHSGRELPNPLLEALRNYSENLARLLPLEPSP